LNKPLSLLFAVTAILLLVGVGVALGFQNIVIAIVCFISFFVVMGIGFMLKAKWQKKS